MIFDGTLKMIFQRPYYVVESRDIQTINRDFAFGSRLPHFIYSYSALNKINGLIGGWKRGTYHITKENEFSCVSDFTAFREIRSAESLFELSCRHINVFFQFSRHEYWGRFLGLWMATDMSKRRTIRKIPLGQTVLLQETSVIHHPKTRSKDKEFN